MAIYFILAFSTNIYAQDSARLVPVTAWRLSRLIDEVKAGRVCDTLAIKQDSTIRSLHTALTHGKTLIQLRTIERDLMVESNELWRKRWENGEALTKEKVKEQRRQKRVLLLGVILEAVVIVLLL